MRARHKRDEVESSEGLELNMITEKYKARGKKSMLHRYTHGLKNRMLLNFLNSPKLTI